MYSVDFWKAECFLVLVAYWETEQPITIWMKAKISKPILMEIIVV